jgi:hypothetical protein
MSDGLPVNSATWVALVTPAVSQVASQPGMLRVVVLPSGLILFPCSLMTPLYVTALVYVYLLS